MAETTPEFTEASKCFRCKLPGEPAATVPSDGGSTLHVFFCRTEGCRWEDTSWVVQVMKNGTLAHRRKGEKDFPVMPQWQIDRARRQIEVIEHEQATGTQTGPGDWS